MILLDTDHVSILQRESELAESLRDRLSGADDLIGTTAITLEEQSRSWISQIGRQKRVIDQVPYYDRLIAMFDFFSAWEIVGFSEQAAAEFENFRKQRIRVATTDLKIASIAYSGDFLLLTANKRDFERIPNLRFENWLSVS